MALDKKKEGLSKLLYKESKKVVKYSTTDLQNLVEYYTNLLQIENKRLSL